jgi:hypothetical protein
VPDQPPTPNALTFERPPVLWRQYVRGAVLGAQRYPAGPFRPRVPPASARVERLEVDVDHLHHYRRLCGFSDSAHLPPTYPYVIATPVAAAMLVRSDFPYPLLGVVHVRQRIEQVRALVVEEALSVRTWFGDEREVARGVEFDTHVEVEDEEGVAWRGTSVALVRDPARAKAKRESSAPIAATTEGLDSIPVPVAADMGRRYASLTQDYNPIHLWPATARLFGYTRPIVHGMWSLARGLAEYQAQIPRGPFVLDCEFRKPVMLPCEVRLFHYEDETGWGFSMRDASGEKKHVECNVRRC